MIVGIGIDLIEVERISQAIRRHRNRFCGRIFTDEERAYCDKQANPYPSFAARFAVKEAVIKALGIVENGAILLKEIQVVNLRHGKPEVRFTGKALDLIHQLRVDACHISITHTAVTAGAVAILENFSSPSVPARKKRSPK